MSGHLRSFAWIMTGALLGILFFAFRPAAHALPEYATRTGESCATCHVNPAGGGPRTVRGTLWLAAGRPDKVPLLPGSTEPANPAVSSNSADGAALYARSGCAGCHGASGEGGPGPSLNPGDASTERLTQLIRDGQGAMPGTKPEALSDAQLATLVQYVQSIGHKRGGVSELQGRPAMKPPAARCGAGAASTDGSCGGN